jgi:hypothetical protein
VAEGCLGPILLQRAGEAAGRGEGLEQLDVLAAVSAWWSGVTNASLELLGHMHLALPGGDEAAASEPGAAANSSSADAVDDARGEGCSSSAAGKSAAVARCLPSLASCLPLGRLLGSSGSPAGGVQAAMFDDDAAGAGLGKAAEELSSDAINDDLVSKVLKICDNAEWTPISNDDGIKVWRTSLPPDLAVGGQPLGKTSQFYAIMAQGILDAPPHQVHTYFIDNSRVREYNEYCKEIKDLEQIDANTKITWSASGKVGPFKERDFVTRVHYRTLPDGLASFPPPRPASSLPGTALPLQLDVRAHTQPRDTHAHTHARAHTHTHPRCLRDWARHDAQARWSSPTGGKRRSWRRRASATCVWRSWWAAISSAASRATTPRPTSRC